MLYCNTFGAGCVRMVDPSRLAPVLGAAQRRNSSFVVSKAIPFMCLKKLWITGSRAGIHRQKIDLVFISLKQVQLHGIKGLLVWLNGRARHS